MVKTTKAAEIVKLADGDKVAEEAARRWVSASQEAVRERGAFRVALAGGSTPRALYSLLASSQWSSQIEWDKTHVFWGDERRVAPSHPDSNYRMARELLLDHVPVPPDQVHPMQGTGLASSTLREYEADLRRHFQLGRREWPRFDLVLLGMGADGHVASIFPGTRAVSDLSNMVVAYEVPQLGEERITLTLAVINQARSVLFMVCGEEKARAVAATLQGRRLPSTYPGQAVQPVDGTVTWLLDK